MSDFVMNVPLDDSDAMDEFQQFMDGYHDCMLKYIDGVAKQLNVSSSCANDIVYLRSRSRWTQELEDELIKLHKEGNPPNICDFGN